MKLAESMAVAMTGDKDAVLLIDARAALFSKVEYLAREGARLKKLAALESNLVPENRVCYYLRNLSELDRLIALDEKCWSEK